MRLKKKMKEDMKNNLNDTLNYINIEETSGDVIKSKPFNHDFKYASMFPTPGIEDAIGPYEDEDDKIYFFGEESSESEPSGVSDESLPKINYANKKNRYRILKDIFRMIK